MFEHKKITNINLHIIYIVLGFFFCLFKRSLCGYIVFFCVCVILKMFIECFKIKNFLNYTSVKFIYKKSVTILCWETVRAWNN